MPEAERKVADAKMLPRARPLRQTATIPLPVAGTNKFRAVVHPPPKVVTNVVVTWTLEPMPPILSAIQAPTNAVKAYTWLEGTTNFRSWYQRTDLMPYAASNGAVLKMIEAESFRAVWGYKK